MNKDQILKTAADAVIAHSASTKTPVAQIISREEKDQAIHIYYLFADIQTYADLESDGKLKDELMGVFIRHLTSNAFPFDEQVQLKFHFSIQD